MMAPLVSAQLARDELRHLARQPEAHISTISDALAAAAKRQRFAAFRVVHAFSK